MDLFNKRKNEGESVEHRPTKRFCQKLSSSSFLEQLMKRKLTLDTTPAPTVSFKPKESTSGCSQCRKLVNGLQSFATLCRFCDKTFCSDCISTCAHCQEFFCGFCSVKSYDGLDRTFCLSCVKTTPSR